LIASSDTEGIPQEADDNSNLSSLLHCKSIIYELWATNDGSSWEVNKLNTFISPLNVPIAKRFWL